MRRLLLTATFVCAGAMPALAQDDTDALSSALERGLQLLFEGLQEDMGPALEDFRAWAETFGPSMQNFMEEMGPALSDLFDEVQDWTAYEPPEMLPNGDIIIRKRPPAPDKAPETPPDTAPVITDI